MITIDISRRIIDKYDIKTLIGRGGFGLALLAIDKEKGDKVVIKQVDFKDKTGRSLELCQQEGSLLSSLSHQNIAKCKEFFIEDHYQYIVMDYIEGGDLEKKIEEHKKDNEKFDEFIIIKWILEISNALKYCNDKNIIHRDIKPNNIFIDKNNSAILADFGISKILERKTEEALTCIGTKVYVAPEMLLRKKHSFSFDIWSLGILLFELCTLNHPLEFISSNHIENYVRGNFPKVTDKKYSKEISDFDRKNVESKS